MKRSEVNYAIRSAMHYFQANGWDTRRLSKWDVTDFKIGLFRKLGLVTVELRNEQGYCEKLMYAWRGQTTPAHYHKQKREEIICRTGELAVELWIRNPESSNTEIIDVEINGKRQSIKNEEPIILNTGEKITIPPLVWHSFYPKSPECIIGSISTEDKVDDFFFQYADIKRMVEIEEDEVPLGKLMSERPE